MKHWLYPFKDKIIDFSYTSEDITVTIEATKEELNLNMDRDTLLGLGVKVISIDYAEKRLITLVIHRNKINQKLIEDYHSCGKLLT